MTTPPAHEGSERPTPLFSTEIHDCEYFLMKGDTHAGIIFPQPDFPVSEIVKMITLLNGKLERENQALREALETAEADAENTRTELQKFKLIEENYIASIERIKAQLTAAQSEFRRLIQEIDSYHRLAADARVLLYNNGFGPNLSQQNKIDDILFQIAGLTRPTNEALNPT